MASFDAEQSQWDMLIEPKRHLLQINLKEVWKYRDLIVLFVRRDFVSRYKQTILGPFWFILNPLISALIYNLIFATFAKIPTEGPPLIFYLTGIIGWQYFALCVQGTSSTFVTNAPIFGKVYFPRLVAPISIVISALIQFVIQFFLWLAVVSYYAIFKDYDITITKYIVLLPLLVLNLAILALGFGILISSLTTKYRDLTNFLSFGIQLWMYGSAIIYPVSAIPPKWQTLVQINPVVPILETLKHGLIGGGSFSSMGLLYSMGFALTLLFIGILTFNKTEQNFMDTV